MSAAVTTVSQGETETFESQPVEAKSDQTVVENVWTKRSMEKQQAVTNATKEQNQQNEIESKETKETAAVSAEDQGIADDDFQKVKGKKDKRERDIIVERNKDDRGKRSEKRELERKDSDKKEKKEEKKEETKEVVKKFDNVNYIEAPLPKTNPWAKSKSPVIRSQSQEAG